MSVKENQAVKFAEQSRLRWLPYLVFACLASGCQMIPGLRISTPEESNEGRSYKIVNKDDGSFQAVSAGELGYRTIAVTPQVLTTQATTALAPLPLDLGSPVLQPQPDDEYKIGAGDNLSVTVFDAPQISNFSTNGTSTQTVGVGAQPSASATSAASYTTQPGTSGALVAADGTIFYPYVGYVKVTGKTAHEVAVILTKGLTRVMREPQVDVRVASFRSHRVVVGGQVVAPGVDTLNDLPETLLDVIHDRGGLKPGASQRRFYLTRGGKTYEIPLTQKPGTGYGALSQAEPGDFIFVPDVEEDQVFVLGEVGKVSPVPMAQGRMSLTEALTATGGLNGLTASDSGILVFRRANANDSDARPIVFTIDMSHAEGLLLAGEFNLQPRDVVYVQATGFAKYNLVVNQLLPTITSVFEIERFTKDIK